jgi:hypothetical protein
MADFSAANRVGVAALHARYWTVRNMACLEMHSALGYKYQ